MSVEIVRKYRDEFPYDRNLTWEESYTVCHNVAKEMGLGLKYRIGEGSHNGRDIDIVMKPNGEAWDILVGATVGISDPCWNYLGYIDPSLYRPVESSQPPPIEPENPLLVCCNEIKAMIEELKGITLKIHQLVQNP